MKTLKLLSIELLVQFLVLAATAALFWIARRDLASRREIAPAPPGDDATHLAEMEQLCATLEALATSLARRLDAVERQMTSAQNAYFAPPQAAYFAPPPDDSPTDPRHASAYALVDAGTTDPVEIARQTGLGRGEVDLILSLRARRAI